MDFEKNYSTKMKNITVNISVFVGIALILISFISTLMNNKLNKTLILFSYIIFAIIFVLVSADMLLCKNKNMENNLEIEKLVEKNKNLSEVNDSIRCFKHDFNNIIQAITGYIDLNDIEALRIYFESLVKDCHHLNMIDKLNYEVCDNPAIYSILINKYKKAQESNIKINIEIVACLKELSNKSYVIARMLGILLDNAIEASLECEEKIINVRIIKELNKHRTLIVIENTYENKEIDTNKIFDKNYTTKVGKGNSGLGLWKIRDILRKDMNLDLFTTKDEKMFRQQLEIYEECNICCVSK